ncbi:pilus assembly protein, partial [Enterobacter cloacae]
TNNPYLAFGVTYNGIDYDIPDIKIDTGACLDKQDDKWKQYQEAACNGVTIQKNVTFTVRFRLYVKLKAIPKEQFDYTFPSVTVLTFDGSGGINTLSKAKNLHYDITGLSNIHFLDCGVDIRIYPENQIVNFGQFTESAVNANAVTSPFSISTIRDATAGCSEQFDVTTSFYTTDTLYDNTHLDMGNGLLMRLIDKTNGDVTYNQYLPFATYHPDDTETTLTHDYTAELTRKPGEAVIPGPFSKDIIVKINYQ